MRYYWNLLQSLETGTVHELCGVEGFGYVVESYLIAFCGVFIPNNSSCLLVTTDNGFIFDHK